ncbi:ABC transporter substrate-binding protein [Solihabitans fulvus]|uniref:ABC transporter substrate-binding protein n=1 Tax=Solihabitans fulvus TaxID=1892852 RepID=A0A5B2WK77_9PSEU|nr:ABC transporter substrate-binding protein [Solihabitans fulvus]KAA2252473.1 ABC transporter substrate-binding protein [Solihabitans fulvus]
MNRSTQRWAVAACAVVAFGATACSSGTPAGSTTGTQAPAAKQAVPIGTAADSKGPDPEVPGAKSGGTVTVYQRADFNHLDPARLYSSGNQTAALLLTRQLTTYQHVGDQTKLVGDLATDTGSTTDGGKTWKFTLKDGLKYEDGSPIAAGDVKYGIERTFQKELTGGPQYLQMWLTGKSDFSAAYPGPWQGQELDAIETPDQKTIVLHLTSVHADLPYTMAMQCYSPVPKAKDTHASFDQHPFSSGPYKIDSHDTDKSMALSRSTGWDAATDPARHAYPDKFAFSFGGQNLDIDQRLIAANGEDRNAMTFNVKVTADVAQQVMTNPELKARTINGLAPFSEYFAINNRRVTDVKVRQAIITAFPKEQVRQIFGGPLYGDFTTTILSPVTTGYENYDLYKVPPAGDPAKAKQLLAEAGKPNPTIVYAYASTTQWEQAAVAISDALTRAGFTVVRKPISDKDYYDEMGKVDNQFDLYWAGWGPDWPSASTVIPPVLDGRQIANSSGNTSLFDDQETKDEIDRISQLSDLTQAGAQWAALDKKIMAKAPIVPWTDSRQISVNGPGLGGLYQGFLGTIYPTDVFVK